MIAICDHHCVDYVDKVRQAAENTPLVVLPGVELSTIAPQLNDVYFLALFPKQTPKSKLDDLLNNLGISAPNRGNCHFRVIGGAERIIREVRNSGGILISNHLDKNKQRQAFFPAMIEEYGILAFDLKNISYQNNLKRRFPQKRLQCFSFSDAHNIAQVGKKYSIAPLADCSFRALKNLLNG